MDQSVYLCFLIAGVRRRVGLFSRQDVVDQADEWTLLCGRDFGER